MPLHFGSFEEMLELLGEKVVQTEKGGYIRVEDLKALDEELGKARAAQREKDAMPKPTGFAAANEAAKNDPEFKKLFDPPATRAPAVDRETNVAPEEKPDESAAAA